MADTRASGSLTVTIEESCITTGQDNNIQVEVNADDNGGATCFEPGQNIYVRVYTSPYNLAIDFDTTYGTYSYEGAFFSTHDEELEINDGEGTTSYPIYSLTSRSWHGDNPCAINSVQWGQGYTYLQCPACTDSPEGGDSCELTFGVLNVEYTSYYRKYRINVPASGKVIIYAIEE